MSDSLIIIPTYNEEENIEKLIKQIFSFEKEFHVLVVDDRSPDKTSQIIKQLQEEFPKRLFLEEREGKMGLGTAYIHGFKWALAKKYSFIFEMDADFSHNPKDLIRLYKEVKDKNADMAIGSRYVKGVNIVNWPMSRLLMSFFASKYVKFITGIPVHDSTAGFKCYKRKVLETIDLDKIKFVGYAFQIEMKFKLWKKGCDIQELPIVFVNREKGVSKMNGSIIWEAIFGVIYLKFVSIFKRI